MKPKSYIVYAEYENYIRELCAEDVKRAVEGFFLYARTGELPALSGKAETYFQIVKHHLDRDMERYERQCAARAATSGGGYTGGFRVSTPFGDVEEYDPGGESKDAFTGARYNYNNINYNNNYNNKNNISARNNPRAPREARADYSNNNNYNYSYNNKSEESDYPYSYDYNDKGNDNGNDKGNNNACADESFHRLAEQIFGDAYDTEAAKASEGWRDDEEVYVHNDLSTILKDRPDVAERVYGNLRRRQEQENRQQGRQVSRRGWTIHN